MVNTALYTIIAVLPSIVWLLFYLRKDVHPEPNRMVTKIFYWGILATLAALALEFLYSNVLTNFSLQNISLLVIGGAAFIEEYLKYFVVKIKVLKNPEFDEPIDAMLYLIIAALGFAAAENVFLLNGLYSVGMPIKDAFQVALGRFVSATFLHALASGIVGYFLAHSLILKRRERKSFVGLGILIATCLHGIYNYIIMELEPRNENFIILLGVLLVFMAISVSLAFKNLNKIKSICKL